MVRYGDIVLPTIATKQEQLETCAKVETYRKNAAVSLAKLKSLYSKLEYEFAAAEKSANYQEVDRLIALITLERKNVDTFLPEEFTIPTVLLRYYWTLEKSELEAKIQDESLPVKSFTIANMRGTLGKSSMDILPGPEVNIYGSTLMVTLDRPASWTDICILRYDVNVRGQVSILDRRSQPHFVPFEFRYRGK
jgi:hypothetical protein